MHSGQNFFFFSKIDFDSKLPDAVLNKINLIYDEETRMGPAYHWLRQLEKHYEYLWCPILSMQSWIFVLKEQGSCSQGECCMVNLKRILDGRSQGNLEWSSFRNCWIVALKGVHDDIKRILDSCFPGNDTLLLSKEWWIVVPIESWIVRSQGNIR